MHLHDRDVDVDGFDVDVDGEDDIVRVYQQYISSISAYIQQEERSVYRELPCFLLLLYPTIPYQQRNGD